MSQAFLGAEEIRRAEEMLRYEMNEIEIYQDLLKIYLFGRLGITEENYKKYEEFQGDGDVFENLKEVFVCNLIYYLTCLSKAKIFLEDGKSSLEGADRFYRLSGAFKEIVLNASHHLLTDEDEKEISGILADIFAEHLSVSYALRKRTHKLLVKKNDEILNKK